MTTLSQVEPSVTLNQPTKRIPWSRSRRRISFGNPPRVGNPPRIPRLNSPSRPLRTLKNVTISGTSGLSPASGHRDPDGDADCHEGCLGRWSPRSVICCVVIGLDDASLRLRDTGLPAPTATALGEEDAQEEDARHAHEEEQDHGDHEEDDEHPHRPVEREEADGDEQQDDREEDRLGDEAAEPRPFVGVKILVVPNRQAMPRLCARGVAGRIVPYPSRRRWRRQDRYVTRPA